MTDTEFSRRLKLLAGTPVSKFVLHREPMLLLDELVDLGPEFAICAWKVRAGNKFMVPGRGVPAYLGIEYMAQCIAIHDGARERVDGFPPPIGLLLGTRQYKAEERYFDIGARYFVECNEQVRNPDGMGSFDCRIYMNSQTIVNARLAVLQKPRRTSGNE